VSTFNATSVLNQFHANLALITTASPGTLTRSAYRFTLDKEPDSGPDGLYFVDLAGADAYERKWGSGETIITGRVSVRTAYFRGGGSAGGGDRRTVMRNASDDCQLIADVCENPDNYNSSASGIRSIIFEGFSRVGDLPRSEIWETRFTTQWRSDLQTRPVQDLMVASLISDSLAALSALPVLSLATGTGAVVKTGPPFSVYLLDRENDAGDVDNGEDIIGATGVLGAVWRRHATTSSPVWQGSSGSYNLPTTTAAGAAVEAIIETQALADNAELLRVASKGRDISTGTAQNGPGVVGTVLGGVTDLNNPFICDSGDFLYQLYGSFQKFLPVVINPNYLYINSAGTPDPITRLVGVYLPHVPLNVVGGGHIDIGEAIGFYMDGDVDPNGDVTITGRRLSIRTGHGICADQGLWAGDPNANTHGGFVDLADGSSMAAAAVGHGRIGYSPGVGFILRNEAANNPAPLVNLSQYFANFDPGALAYASGTTVVKTFLPSDSGLKNLQTVDPRRWTLPGQIAISGGTLTAGIRFNLNTGSAQTITNATGVSVSTGRDSVFLALVGAWITSVDLLVINSSGSTSGSQSMGNYQFEGVFA